MLFWFVFSRIWTEYGEILRIETVEFLINIFIIFPLKIIWIWIFIVFIFIKYTANLLGLYIDLVSSWDHGQLLFHSKPMQRYKDYNKFVKEN